MNPYLFAGLMEHTQMAYVSRSPAERWEPKEPINPEVVFAAIHQGIGVSKEDIVGQKRTRIIVDARIALVGILRSNKNEYTFKEIGDIMGGKDHSSAVHLGRQFEALSSTDLGFRTKLSKIKKYVKW